MTTSCSLTQGLTLANTVLSGAVTYMQHQLKDSVVVYKCPLWLAEEKWKLSDEEKAATPLEIKRKMVAFNRKVEAFCEETSDE